MTFKSAIICENEEAAISYACGARDALLDQGATITNYSVIPLKRFENRYDVSV